MNQKRYQRVQEGMFSEQKKKSCDYRNPFFVSHQPPSSRCVLISWCLLQSGWWFSSSQNSSNDPLCGVTWSTTVARVITFSLAHSTQKGWFIRYTLLYFCQREPYPRCAAVPRLVSFLFRTWVSQYSAEVTCLQPGYLQGFIGLLGTTITHHRPT